MTTFSEYTASKNARVHFIHYAPVLTVQRISAIHLIDTSKLNVISYASPTAPVKKATIEDEDRSLGFDQYFRAGI